MASRALMARLRIAFSSWLGIGQRVPQPAGDDRLDLDRPRPACGAAGRPCPRTSRPRLSTRGSSGWRRAKASSWPVRLGAALAPRAARCAAARGAARCPRSSRCQQLEVAADDLQQVVEVVRDAAGELADRLHLLRLAQRCLGLQPPVTSQRRDDEAATGHRIAGKLEIAAADLELLVGIRAGTRRLPRGRPGPGMAAAVRSPGSSPVPGRAGPVPAGSPSGRRSAG